MDRFSEASGATGGSLNLCLLQILYTGIVIYAPALALNQGMLFQSFWKDPFNIPPLGHLQLCTTDHVLPPPSVCSNWYGPVGCSYLHWSGLHLLLHHGV